MKKTKKNSIRIISIFLAILMLLSGFAVLLSVHAAPGDDEETTEAAVAVTEAVTDTQSDNAVNESADVDEPDVVEGYSVPAANQTEKQDTAVANPDDIEKAAEVAVSDSNDNEVIASSGTESQAAKTNFSLISLDLQYNIGTVPIKLTDEFKKSYNIDLAYSDGKYMGASVLPEGKYTVELLFKNSRYKLSINESEFTLAEPGDAINLTVKDYKDKEAGIGGFFRNNSFVLLGIVVLSIIYVVYMKKQRIEAEKQG